MITKITSYAQDISTGDLYHFENKPAFDNGDDTYTIKVRYSEYRTDKTIVEKIIVKLLPDSDFQSANPVQAAYDHYAYALPNCDCTICRMGVDAYIFNYHPSEY